jgi:DNA-binding transcriptional MocR family regulator
MQISLRRDHPVPLYLQIKSAIREKILSGELPPYYRLPPDRHLAENLGVNRSTVVNAYRELKAEGLVESHVGRGTTVCEMEYPEEEAWRQSVMPLNWERYLRPGEHDRGREMLRFIRNVRKERDVIDFSTCYVPEFFENPRLHHHMSALFFSKMQREYYAHPCVEGLRPLREVVAERQKSRGIHASYDEIIITSGSQQAIDIMAKAFVGPGDMVLVEDPTYIIARQSFAAQGARILGIPMGEDGMRLDILEGVLKRYAPKLIYTVPTFHNPTGSCMSRGARRRLLDLAYRYQVPVLEDDPFYDLRFEGESVLPLKAMDHMEHVIYVSSLAKPVAPGLRIGWICAPHAIMDRLIHAKKIADLACSGVVQSMMNTLLREGVYEELLEQMRSKLRKRRDLLASSLGEISPELVVFSPPTGGFDLWCSFLGEIHATKLLYRVAEKGVLFTPGEYFTLENRMLSSARFSFSGPREEDIPRGIEILAQALRRYPREFALHSRREREETRPIV